MTKFLKSLARDIILPWALTAIGGLIGKKLTGSAKDKPVA